MSKQLFMGIQMAPFCSGAMETKDTQMLKRFFDILFSALGLILLARFWLSLRWRLRSPHPDPRYTGYPCWERGELFRMLKLRMMVAIAEALGGSCTSDDDPG
jgi:lipopolysaccharide/colanic/teichoic acid biosynthesis glycosyltransferase